MTYEQIEHLDLADCRGILISRLYPEGLPEAANPSQEELEAELAIYKAELIAAEDARLCVSIQ